MRHTLRAVTPEEESALGPHLGRGGVVLGANEAQRVYAVRAPSGDITYIDYDAVQSGGVFSKVLRVLFNAGGRK